MITPLRHAKGGQIDKAVARRWHGVVAIIWMAGHRISGNWVARHGVGGIHGMHRVHATVVVPVPGMVTVIWIMGLHTARARLMAVGHLAGRCLWCEQGHAADHGHLVDREAKRHLELILHDLVVMKLDVGRHQIAQGNAREQHTLACRSD